MPSIVPGYEYDIFISYRQNDNRSGWVTTFVQALQDELGATLKEPISIYYDTNPHDGILESHQVNQSLENKIKCLIFIPVLSHTYCDPKSFAWEQEFIPFCRFAQQDGFGLNIRLSNNNYASRILPVQIHDLDAGDQSLFEKEAGNQLRSMDFIFRSQGVNRPLTPLDARNENLNKTFFRDQINKTANAIDAIIKAIQKGGIEYKEIAGRENVESGSRHRHGVAGFWQEVGRRNVFRAALTYLVVALLLHQVMLMLVPVFQIEERFLNTVIWALIIGFPIAVVLAWIYERGPTGFIRTTSEQSWLNPYPPSKKKPLTGGVVITLLAILLLSQQVYYNYIKRDALIAADVKSIAVLPFENRSGDPKDDYIAEGITDDIINNLSIISHLKVTDRRAIQQYRGDLLPYDEIGKELQVMAILIGSIQREGNKIVVRAQMIDAVTNSFLWGNTFQRTIDDIMIVQSEIAKLIADRLEIKLNELEIIRLNKEPTKNATAYDHYLKGRSLYYKYKPSANDSAINEFKEAIEIDPKYAIAWAGLGDAYSQARRLGRDEVWLDSSMYAGMMAIQLDSNLAEAYKAVANAYVNRRQYDKAFPYLLKSIEINPGYYQAVGNLGTTYLLMGDLAEALRWEKKAAGMSPNNWIPYQITGWIYRLLADLSNAESWLLKSLELDSTIYDTYELLGYTYVAQGRNEKALELIPSIVAINDNLARVYEVAGLIAHFAGDDETAKKYFQLSIDNNKVYEADRTTYSPVGLGQILLKEGKKIEGEIHLAHALENYRYEVENGSMSVDPPYFISVIYAIRDNKEQSLYWLQKAVDMNWVDYNKFEYGPHFEKYRYDPDFRKIINGVRTKVDKMRQKARQY